MTQAMQNHLRIMLDGPVAMVNGHIFADLVAQALIKRGLAERTTMHEDVPAVKITNRGRLVMNRLSDTGRLRASL